MGVDMIVGHASQARGKDWVAEQAPERLSQWRGFAFGYEQASVFMVDNFRYAATV